MYLSSNQHDQLQTIVTGFEIPFRTYIAIKLTDRYPTENDFTNIINTKTIPYTNSVYTMINSELGKIKANPTATYNQLTNTKNVKEKRIAETEIDVPNVARLISLTIIFKELFQDLLLSFRDENLYLQQAIIYKYVRNKLDHRGCKTLETYDMTMSLDFMSNSLICLKEDESIFWEKSSQVISKEIISLQTSSVNIPIEINNISSMPFPDMKIVCRNKEISEIKEFIYGKPYSFRKPSSLVLYGYGGVGKTALVLESIKQLVQDLQDNTTINNYKPDFLLFFTAKEEILNFSNTTGKIERLPNRYTFNTANSLINLIYKELSVEDFYNFNRTGLIIIDNLETLSLEDRKTIEDFVCYNSPPQIQYIITSRNEENFECRKKVGGFDDDVSGRAFIMDYIDENNFDVKLSDDEIRTLLQISMGNTLVLVLCLRRLSLKLTTMDGLVSDTTSPTYISHLKKEIESIPANGFTIISEYMFKNSFQEIEDIYSDLKNDMAIILKIFAVYPSETIDLYTISMLSQKTYSEANPILDLLCKYLIIEKNEDCYKLNQFAEKYIIELFMPDSETYEKISSEISSSTRKIQRELNELQKSIESNESLKRIIQDWNVITDGDKIAVAKSFKIYGEVDAICKRSSKFHISTALLSAIKEIVSLEQTTMHPYIKYQKARIYHRINDTRILEDDYYDDIIKAYNDTIWTIKTNPIYQSIKATRSFAAILWKYGIDLSNSDAIEHKQNAARYLEESTNLFEQLHDTSEEYYKSLILLGNVYMDLYLHERETNLHYLRKARIISNKLLAERDNYYGKTKGRARELRENLLKYGAF